MFRPIHPAVNFVRDDGEEISFGNCKDVFEMLLGEIGSTRIRGIINQDRRGILINQTL